MHKLSLHYSPNYNMRFVSVLLVLVAVSIVDAASIGVRLITYNVRLRTNDLESGEQHWNTRLPLMTKQLNDEIKESSNLLMCLQEPFRDQLQDLQARFAGPRWDFLGWGRDGYRSGEYSSVIYQSSIWEKMDEKTYWLTEELAQGNNENVAKGWDAQHPRILNMARFRHRQTGAYIVYGCTHVEYQGKVAAQESGKWINIIAERWAEDGKYPVFIAADLNHEEGSKPYNNIVAGMSDIRQLIPDNGSRHEDTYTGFTSNTNDDELIDFIFMKETTKVQLVSYNVLNNKPGTIYISDHRPVVANLRINY